MWIKKDGIKVSLSEIAKYVEGELIGEDKLVEGLCRFKEPLPNCISYQKDITRLTMEEFSAHAGLLVPLDKDLPQDTGTSFIRVADPVDKFVDVVSLFYDYVSPPPGISDQASVADSAKIGQGVHIGAFTSVAENVEIGDGTVIHPQVVIYPNVKIGKGAIIHSGACIRENCEVGAGAIVQNGAILGADGFGYAPNPTLGLRQVPQLGMVKLGDAVEVGANTCIDRGTLGDTELGVGSKVDNLVQLGHNVRIGNHSILCGQVGVAGSVTIGDQAVLGGMVGVADHVSIGDKIRVAAKGGVVSDLEEKGDYAGFPAVKAGLWRRQYAALKQVPKLLKLAKQNEEND